MAYLTMETPKKLREEKEHSYIKLYDLDHVLSQVHFSALGSFWSEMERQERSSTSSGAAFDHYRVATCHSHKKLQLKKKIVFILCNLWLGTFLERDLWESEVLVFSSTSKTGLLVFFFGFF